MGQPGMCGLIWAAAVLLSRAGGVRGFQCLDSYRPCQNGARCTMYSNGEAACVCPNGWIGDYCQFKDPCVPTPCVNGGACQNSIRGGTVQYECSCPKGFRGQDCSLIDACASNPCENGARCTNWNGRYNCTCPPGYQGRSCRVDIDECRTSGLCQNGGQCINTPGSFRCRCPSSFTGQFCEAIYVPCSPSQCQNGGTCRPTGDLSYQCVCLPGFEGPNCEVNVDDCPDHKCMNGGTCVDGVNTYNCQCPPEWTGQFCTEDVDECQLQPNACHNGGTCFNTQGGHTCVCVNGWTGESCSENIDDCATAVCFNGATCHDRVASFYCECPMGKTGLLCHLEDACVSNPCHKDAMCDTNPVNGRAICTCPPGFTGGACDQDVDECSIGANPCEHFGRCMNTRGSFQCQCGRGYTGPRCEMDVNEYLSTPCQNDATCTHSRTHFLFHKLVSLKSTTELPLTSESHGSKEKADGDASTTLGETASEVSKSESVSHTAKVNPNKKKRNDCDQKILDGIDAILKRFDSSRETPKDSIVLFLLSMEEDLRMVPADKLPLVKLEMMQVLHRALYPTLAAQNTSPSSKDSKLAWAGSSS